MPGPGCGGIPCSWHEAQSAEKAAPATVHELAKANPQRTVEIHVTCVVPYSGCVAVGVVSAQQQTACIRIQQAAELWHGPPLLRHSALPCMGASQSPCH